MKTSVVLTGACMIWTIISLYQCIINLSEKPSYEYIVESRHLQNNFRYFGFESNGNSQQSLSSTNVTAVALATLKEYSANTIHRSFPRWGSTLEEEEKHGMEIEPILNFILNSSVAAFARKQRTYFPDYIATSDHGDAVGKWFPEVLYVLDHRGLWVSQRHRNICALDLPTISDKLVPAEHLMMNAFKLLQSDASYSAKTWPTLTKSLIDNQNVSFSGFPILFWFGDYTECNYQNWKGDFSIPLFTNAAHANCNYSFPFVTYQTGRDSNVNWKEVIPQYQITYPWKEKISKVVWRGSITGQILNSTHKSPRWNMLQKIRDLNSQYDIAMKTENIPPFPLDVAATRLPPRHKDWSPYLNEVGGLVGGMLMEDFQKYRGILDIDGNSWSSRFGRLLCYNSVVLKVEPSWIDYFYFKDDDDGFAKLQPWVHYIPVKADLSDLMELATFVMDPNNDMFLLEMVAQANSWCVRNLNRRRVSTDILNIWERYIQLLNIADPNWSGKQWKSAKQEMFHPQNPLIMDNTFVESK
jgi:Glycosyl transferase family 90